MTETFSLIPHPKRLAMGNGVFELSSACRIPMSGDVDPDFGHLFAEYLAGAVGLAPPVQPNEGFITEAQQTDHAVLQGIDLASMPPVLGYNRTRPRAGCEAVASWSGGEDPAFAIGQFGAGRVLAYTSDPARHWGCNFVF